MNLRAVGLKRWVDLHLLWVLGVLTAFRQFTLKKKGKETQIRVTSTILTNYVAQFTFFFFLLRSLTSQTPKSLASKGYAVESLVTTTSIQRPLFLADSPYFYSCLNLSTTASFFCPQGGCCWEVQLYNRRPQDSRTRTTTSTRFDFKCFANSQKINSLESFIVLFVTRKN